MGGPLAGVDLSAAGEATEAPEEAPVGRGALRQKNCVTPSRVGARRPDSIPESSTVFRPGAALGSIPTCRLVKHGSGTRATPLHRAGGRSPDDPGHPAAGLRRPARPLRGR